MEPVPTAASMHNPLGCCRLWSESMDSIGINWLPLFLAEQCILPAASLQPSLVSDHLCGELWPQEGIPRTAVESRGFLSNRAG